MKIKNPETMLFNHGKSFHFASQVFSKNVFIRVTYLYAFCRFIDDTADEQDLELALVDLQKISNLLKSESINTDQFSAPTLDLNYGDQPQAHDEIDFNDLATKLQSYGVHKSYLNILVEGALFDVNKKSIQNDKDLIRYCFHVAGVVGLMMCPLIHVKNKKAYPFAIDLGIGMQLTNICRDVLEDAQNGRIYLPELNLKSIDHKQIVRKYLDLADIYYRSSFKGLAYIPFRPRIAILLASNIYRAIGDKIRKNNYDVLSGRTYLSKIEKVWVSTKALFQIFNKNFWFAGLHESKLHVYIQDLILDDTTKNDVHFSLQNMDFSAGHDNKTNLEAKT